MEVKVIVDGVPNPVVNMCANDTLTVSCKGNGLPPDLHHAGCDSVLIAGELEKADRRLVLVLDLFDEEDRSQVEDLLGLSPTDTFVARRAVKP